MVVSGSHKAMDTEFRVSIVVDSEDERAFAESAAAAVFERIDSLERLLTRFEDTSDVAVVRALAPGEVAQVARETMDLLVRSAEVCAATRGAFDPTVGPVMDALRAPRRPDAAPCADWDRLAGGASADAFANKATQQTIVLSFDTPNGPFSFR